MDDSANDALIGTILQQTYRVERLVGKGGMGTVYEAAHLRLPRRFAIKVLSPETARQPDLVIRFRREAEITSAIGHPHIVEVVDFNQADNGAPYLVMELLQGEDLEDRLLHLSSLDVAQTAAILAQAASALHAVHQRGIVHRDLKPSNIFLCPLEDGSDFVKVLDFGISKVLANQSLTTLGSGGGVMGTPGYMAPEQAQGRVEDLDHRTDIFAMGAILYRVLSGHKPFEGDSIPTVLYKIVYEPAPPLHEICPHIPRRISDVVADAMAKQPSQRFSSMEVLAQAFKAATVESGFTLATYEAPPAFKTYSGALPLCNSATPSSPTLVVGNVPIASSVPIEQQPVSAIEDTLVARADGGLPASSNPSSGRHPKSANDSTSAWRRILRKYGSLIVAVGIVMGIATWWKPVGQLVRRIVGFDSDYQPIVFNGSINDTLSYLDKMLKQDECLARETILRSLLVTADFGRQRSLLTRLEQCKFIAPIFQQLARVLATASFPQGIAQALQQMPLAAEQRADVEFIRAYLLSRGGQVLMAGAALEQWQDYGQRNPASNWIDPTLALTILSMTNENALATLFLKKHKNNIAALALLAKRELIAGHIPQAQSLLAEVEKRASAYEVALELRGRIQLSKNQWAEAQTTTSRLLALGGEWARRGRQMQADIAIAQGRIKEVVNILEHTARLYADSLPQWAHAIFMRLGDLCTVFRRRGCAQSAYQRAQKLAQKFGDESRATWARLMALALSMPPGRHLSNELKQLLLQLREGGSNSAGIDASALDCLSAWLAQRQGKRLQAGQQFVSVAKHSSVFNRFRLTAAESYLDLGRSEEALELLRPFIAAPTNSEEIFYGIAALYIAAQAARMSGQLVLANQFIQRFLSYWGQVESDLLESSVWRKRVAEARRWTARLSEAGPATLYSLGIKIGIITTENETEWFRLEERIALALKERYRVVQLPLGSIPVEPNKHLNAIPNLERQGIQTILLISPTPEGTHPNVQLRRLDVATWQEVLRATMKLPIEETSLRNTLNQLFPRPTDPLFYGEFVGGMFQRCSHCLRWASEQENIASAGAELELTFASTGRLLPSRVRKVVPNNSRVPICLRECAEQIRLPPFGFDPRDRISIEVYVSIEPNWAMLRTVPHLHFVN